MAFDRRQFLKTTIAGTATLAIGGCNTFASTETKAGSIEYLFSRGHSARGYTSREV